MSNTGSCLCGAVKYTLAKTPTESATCHCSMCRKWSGGAFVAFTVTADEVTITGEEHLNVFKSSDWADAPLV